MKSLADAGHEVTIIAPFQHTEPHRNIKFIDSRINKSEMNVRFANRDYRKMSWLEYIQMFTETMEVDCYNTVQIKEVQASTFSLSNSDTRDTLNPTHLSNQTDNLCAF